MLNAIVKTGIATLMIGLAIILPQIDSIFIDFTKINIQALSVIRLSLMVTAIGVAYSGVNE